MQILLDNVCGYEALEFFAIEFDANADVAVAAESRLAGRLERLGARAFFSRPLECDALKLRCDCGRVAGLLFVERGEKRLIAAAFAVRVAR